MFLQRFMPVFFCTLFFVCNFSHIQPLHGLVTINENSTNIFWSVFDLFRKCTIHFSKIGSTTSDAQSYSLHSTFLAKCKFHQNCVSLHSSYHVSASNKSSTKETMEEQQ